MVSHEIFLPNYICSLPPVRRTLFLKTIWKEGLTFPAIQYLMTNQITGNQDFLRTEIYFAKPFSRYKVNIGVENVQREQKGLIDKLCF